MSTARDRAAGILGPGKMRQLEEAGLVVVDEDARPAPDHVMRSAWLPIHGSSLKRCPRCGEPAMGGDAACMWCGTCPEDDETWRRMRREWSEPSAPIEGWPSPGLDRVEAERFRQIAEEEWGPDHDDQHTKGELAIAAACYAVEGTDARVKHLNGHMAPDAPNGWPWSRSWWKPGSAIRNLEKAGALIIAEIDRLLRRADNSSAADENEDSTASLTTPPEDVKANGHEPSAGDPLDHSTGAQPSSVASPGEPHRKGIVAWDIEMGCGHTFLLRLEDGPPQSVHCSCGAEGAGRILIAVALGPFRGKASDA